jgi:ribosome-binding protein aMBF1 (putative translation factor)
LQKAGGALHDVVQIQQDYSQRMQSASQNDKQGLAQQAQAEAVKAVKSRGLTVDQYNQVIEQARADPGVKQRLIAAAQSAK